MPRSRIFSRKPKPTSGNASVATWANGDMLHQERSSGHVDSPRKPPEQCASDDSQAHDSEAWQVSDDWPEFVPIALDEVEVIKAFLRDALDDLSQVTRRSGLIAPLIESCMGCHDSSAFGADPAA